jgi:hypothetical protein
MAKGWLDNIEKAQTGKKIHSETEASRAKRVAKKVASATGVGLALDQFPGVETAYDAYNVIDAYRQGDPMKIIPNMMGALIPGTAGKAFEAVTDEYLPKTPEKEKEKMKAVLKGKRATPEEMRKAQESVDWSGGFKKLYDDASNGIKNSIDDVVTPLMGLKNGGWLDNYGKEDNYNDYNVSAPEGFEGDGYSNVGRNSSPAWGGSFQMGGSVYPVNYVPEAQTGGSFPGATGFSYARTGDIPSEGPYAKKTMASAQNGQEMQYYQEGLDWQPKTISQNGAWLDNYEEAQTGAKKFKLKDERELATKTAESTNVKKKNFDLEQSKSNKTYINQLAEQQKENKRRKTLTQDQREREDYNARNEQTGSIQTPVEESKWDRTKAIVSNPLTAFGYAARNESLPARFQHGERNTLDNAIDWINPLQGIAAASEIPGELGRGEYLNAGLSALDALDLGVYAKGAMKASKPLLQKGAQQLGNVRMSIAPELRQGLQTAGPSFNNKLLPKELEPYISRIGEPSISREEEVFRNVMGRDYRNAKEIKNTIHLDSNGNIISAPTEAIYDPSKKIGPMHPLKQGGIIKDDRGQWNHPGEITEIGSNEITMEGVPYDVLGVSDTGDTKLMKPGKNYKFKGKKVTEYPMAQNGLRQEQKGLQNLDNLTNFTNYNTKQPGGWLDTL